MSEFEAFLDALRGVPADSLSACAGWTAHEVVAHLTSGAELLAEQAEAHLDGRPAPQVDDWAVRDRPYQMLDDRDLRRRLETAGPQMTRLLNRFDPDDGPAVESDPAARLLLLWGRRPADPRRVRSGLTAELLLRLQQQFGGF